MLPERELRELLARSFEQHDPPEDGLEHGGVEFLRSDEPLNEFYTAIIEAMRAMIEGATKAERARCAAVTEGWLAQFSEFNPEHVTAQDWACDTVRDIADAINCLPGTSANSSTTN